MKAFLKKLRALALPITAGLLALLCLGFCLWYAWLASLLQSQRAAERWQGETGIRFSQLSCYLAEDQKISMQQVYSFRTELLKALDTAAMEGVEDLQLYSDAWSTSGKVNVSTGQGRGQVTATAVGGNYFDFHPIRLLSGSYIQPSDLMKDRVLLDEETAWLLFGGTELSGMSLEVEGQPFVVAGVIEREQDFASTLAYTAGMGIYMSYEAYYSLMSGGESAYTAGAASTGDSATTTGGSSSLGISCYELVSAEPVKGFAMNLAREKFPIGGGLIVDVSSRYQAGTVIKQLSGYGQRSMQTHGVLLPYWENAARCVEDWCLLALLGAIVTGILPAVLLSVIALRYLRRGRDLVAQELAPKAKDKVEEAIRVRQRAAWERRYRRSKEGKDLPREDRDEDI